MTTCTKLVTRKAIAYATTCKAWISAAPMIGLKAHRITPYMVSSPAQPSARLATVTPTCVTLSRRSGFARMPRAARAAAFPWRASSSKRDRRATTNATSAAEKKAFSATMKINRMKRSDISRYNRAVQSSAPVLRAINLSIAVLLVAALAGAYWFAWRSLPQTTGEIHAPISAKATIARDAIGVPHITAATWEDAIFLQGYATAQDRMWQMDAVRRLAAGELAEVLGQGYVEADRDTRRLQIPRLAEIQEGNLTAEARAVLSAYARG